MSPDDDQSKTPTPDSPTVEPRIVTRETGGQSTQRVAVILAALAAAAILVVLIPLIVVNRSAVLVDWVFGDSSVFLAWVVLGAALLGLLLGLLLAVLLQATRSWWLVVAIIVVLVAAAAAWFVLLQQEEAVTPVASPSALPSLSPSPLPSLSPSPSPYASPQPSLAPSPLPPLPPLPSPAPVAWTGSWGRIDGVGGGLVVADDGDGAYEVTFYDGALQVGASVPATPSTDELQLEFIVPSQFSISGPSGPFAATLTLGDDPDTAVLRVTAVDQTTTLIPFRRVPE